MNDNNNNNTTCNIALLPYLSLSKQTFRGEGELSIQIGLDSLSPTSDRDIAAWKLSSTNEYCLSAAASTLMGVPRFKTLVSAQDSQRNGDRFL